MKKIIGFITIVMMVCGMCFIGCDAEGGSSQSGSSEGTSSPSSAVPSTGNTTDTGNQAGDNTTDKVYNIITDISNYLEKIVKEKTNND